MPRYLFLSVQQKAFTKKSYEYKQLEYLLVCEKTVDVVVPMHKKYPEILQKQKISIKSDRYVFMWLVARRLQQSVFNFNAKAIYVFANLNIFIL